jgi:amidophosphoribosyltransferase
MSELRRGDPKSDYLELPEKVKEACGIFGIYLPGKKGKNSTGRDSGYSREANEGMVAGPCAEVCLADGSEHQAAQLTQYGLVALQHRGQESAGIAVTDGQNIQVYKAMGLVNEVFDDQILCRLRGFAAIGHVRYPTTGSSEVVNAQPLLFRYLRGSVALAHNGNLTNAVGLQQLLATQGSVFQSTTDSEVIANLIARCSQNNLEDALMKCMIDLKGAYSLVVLGEKKLIGVRDPYGVRPLCVGRLENGYVLASETCALDTVGAEFIRDLDPGEILVIDEQGLTSRYLMPSNTNTKAACIFEFVYFARPDSVIDGIGVGRARREMGRQLARERKIDADIVISVPDSGTPAALGYALESGIPFEEGLMKNRYIGRTFIQPTQATRNLAVKLKLNPVKETVNGKRVIMVDDSIVRGTTSRQIVWMLREAGATEVHMVISSPPTKHSCFYGIDTSERKELIASKLDVESIREYIGADSLTYLSEEGLLSCFPGHEKEFCTACFSGKYPISEE